MRQVVGVMGAMREEVAGLLEAMGPGRREEQRGGRTYHLGTLFGHEAVVVFSRWGKVAAATTAAHLAVEYGVSEVLFTGVAGGVDPGLHVGDVVVASALWQHDMDARPFFPRHEVPLLGRSTFPIAPERRAAAVAAARAFLAEPGALHAAWVEEFRLHAPRVVEGEVASGDKFFASREDVEALRARLPGVACVEMEGAAVAQVCHEYGLPLTVIRTLSDAADEHAAFNVLRFLEEVASRYSVGILRHLLQAR
jgi:adenosylhomocysteine nucleosidase